MTRDELIEAVAHAIDPRPWTFSSEDDVKRYGEKHDLVRRAKSLKTAARVLDALDALNMGPKRVAKLEGALVMYRDAVDRMNNAMRDGINVHGAMSNMVAAEEAVEYALKLKGQSND